MKIKSKTCRLFLLIAILMTVLLLPQPSLAQEREAALALTLFSGRYSYYHEVTAGKDNIFYLEIRNTGSKAVTNISLSLDKPEGWVIDLELEEIDYLGPGSLRTVDVNIKPPKSTSKGEYRVTITAEANEILAAQSFWVTVSTSFWLWIGAGVALVVIVGFILVFMRFGRQK